MSVLFEMTLLDSERHELLAAHGERSQPRLTLRRHSLAVDILVHNVRNQSTVPIYISSVPDLLQFAKDVSLEWLERRLVEEYGLLRERRKAARESVAPQEPTPCSARSETDAE
jgi:hypothetical protein